MDAPFSPSTLGPYTLVGRIAAGGMAEVYVARRTGPFGFEKTVAVKRILPELAQDADFVAMFVDEARVSARLCHPNVVQVFDFGEDHGELYMAMEYVEGTTVARLVRAAAKEELALPLEVVLHITLSVLRALEHAHAMRGDAGRPLGLVHRDVSPGNMLISRGGEVKLTDFGIVRAAELERRTNVGQVKGKLGYMSPEQVLGKELDPRSDLFTLGIVLAELLTRTPLFGFGNEIEILERIRDASLAAFDRVATNVPDDVKRIVYRSLAPSPADRFSTATLFADAVEEVVRRRRLRLAPSGLSRIARTLGLFPEVVETDESRKRTIAPGRLEGRVSSIPPPSVDDPFGGTAPELELRVSPGEKPVPVPLPRLVELFVTGKLSPTAQVSRAGGEPKELSDVPELRRFVSSPAFRWDGDVLAAEEKAIPFDRRGFVSIFYRIVHARETGVLICRHASTDESLSERRKKVYFVDGVPELVVSTDPRELLGEQLIVHGTVLRVEVDRALAVLPRFGGRLGDALVGLGVLRPVELYRAIFDQVETRVQELFQWQRGTLVFQRGARSHEETIPLAFCGPELIARGVRTSYEADEITAFLSEVKGRLAPSPRPPSRIEALRLTFAEEKVLRGLVSPITLDYLLERERTPADVVRRAVFLGLASETLVADGFTIDETAFVDG
ncbi:MAG: serine/threonine-protein kinase [Polyangiaceae bacterium]